MRITNNTLSSNFLRNLNKNLGKMQKYQNQLSSGLAVSKPSDDPLAISKIMDVKNSIATNEQYNKNISDASGWVETQDNSLTNVIKVLQRVRELTIYGANDTMSPNDKLAISEEVKQSVEAIRDVLNTNFDGRYIFGGQETKNPPFEVTGTNLIYNGDTNNINRSIGNGINITMITSGAEVIGAGNEIGSLLNDVVVALENNDTSTLSNIVGSIDERIDGVLSFQSKIGSISNRLSAAKLRNESENMNLKSLLSEREEVDVAEKYMEYSVMKNVYEASLSIGSKILQPGLLDFLR